MRATPLHLALTCTVAGCLATPNPSPVNPHSDLVALRASDWQGLPSDPRNLVRRPQLDLTYAPGFADLDQVLLLFTGEPDSAWLDDLAQAPLRAEHQSRLVEVSREATGQGAVLVPTHALAADSTFTLAVAGWARTSRGSRVSSDAMPVIFMLHTDADLAAGASPQASWPADGASGIGTNLEAAVLGFDGIVQDFERGVWLQGPDGLAVPAQVTAGPCAEVAPEHAQRYCVRIAPTSRLVPSATHGLRVGAEAHDAHGAPIGPWRAEFLSAAGRDEVAPTLLPLPCAVDEQTLDVGCVLVDDHSLTLRLRANEAVVCDLRVGETVVHAVAPDGACTLRAEKLAPSTSVELALALHDSAGNRTQQALLLRTSPELATLSITEVRADPRGPEPAQEYVELWNYGERAVDLQHFTLDDRLDARGQALGAVRIEPNTRALLVSDDFDASESSDAVPPPGTVLVRIGRTLASGGLSNAGEALFLRDALGHRVSAAPATPRPRPGVCVVRIGPDPRDAFQSSFDYDPNGGCTPGW